jgi:hypothetical protein
MNLSYKLVDFAFTNFLIPEKCADLACTCLTVYSGRKSKTLLVLSVIRRIIVSFISFLLNEPLLDDTGLAFSLVINFNGFMFEKP